MNESIEQMYINDLRKTIERLQKDNKEKSDCIFSLIQENIQLKERLGMDER